MSSKNPLSKEVSPKQKIITDPKSVLIILFIVVCTMFYFANRIRLSEHDREIRQQLEHVKRKQVEIEISTEETKTAANVGEPLKKWEYYFLEADIVYKRNTIFKAPLIIICQTTDCLVNVSGLQATSIWKDNEESRQDLLDAVLFIIAYENPSLYNLRILSLGLQGEIIGDEVRQLRTIDDDSA